MNEPSDEESYSPKRQELLRQEEQQQRTSPVGGGGVYSSPVPETKKIVQEPPEGNACVRFISNHPVVFFLIGIIFVVLIVLAIVLPLTLIKPKAEQMIQARCPDGKVQPRVDCLPDKINLLATGVSLEQACRQRSCCWSASAEFGGPNCVFHYNYGFRNLKTKESSFYTQWYELTRMNAPSAFTRSDIANLEFKLEMHTDNRLRIRIFPRRNFKNKLQRWEVPSGVIGENIFKPDYRVEYSDLPFSFKVIRNSTNTVL
jgi:hypothetical protein